MVGINPNFPFASSVGGVLLHGNRPSIPFLSLCLSLECSNAIFEAEHLTYRMER